MMTLSLFFQHRPATFRLFLVETQLEPHTRFPTVIQLFDKSFCRSLFFQFPSSLCTINTSPIEHVEHFHRGGQCDVLLLYKRPRRPFHIICKWNNTSTKLLQYYEHLSDSFYSSFRTYIFCVDYLFNMLCRNIWKSCKFQGFWLYSQYVSLFGGFSNVCATRGGENGTFSVVGVSIKKGSWSSALIANMIETFQKIC